MVLSPTSLEHGVARSPTFRAVFIQKVVVGEMTWAHIIPPGSGGSTVVYRETPWPPQASTSIVSQMMVQMCTGVRLQPRHELA